MKKTGEIGVKAQDILDRKMRQEKQPIDTTKVSEKQKVGVIQTLKIKSDSLQPIICREDAQTQEIFSIL